MASHLGSWELAIPAIASRAIPLDVVVKRSRNANLEGFLQWYRRKSGARIFPESGTAKDILSAFSAGRFVAFILDQFMGPPIGLPVTFFGRLAGTAAGPALLMEKRAVPVIPLYCYRSENGDLHTVFEPPIFFPPLSENKDQRLFERTQIFNDVMERHIRQHPEQWLWIHRRWKAYRGTPRWKSKFSTDLAVLSVLFWGLVGCRSPGTTETGIVLSAEPTIEVPIVKQIEKREDHGNGSSQIIPHTTVTKEEIRHEDPAKKREKRKMPFRKNEINMVPSPIVGSLYGNLIRIRERE